MTDAGGVSAPQGWRVALAAAIVLCLAYPAVPEPAAGVLFNAAVGLGAALVVGAVWRRRSGSGAWVTVAAGVTLMAAGELWWSVIELTSGAPPPFPSGPDVGYLTGTATLAAGLFWLVRDPDRPRPSEAFLDVGVIAIAGALLLWHNVIDPLVFHPTMAPLETVVAVAYPLLDVIVLAVLAALLLVPRRRIVAIGLAATAGAALLTADYVYARQIAAGGFTGSDVAEIGWMLFYLLMAVAALHPSAARIGARPAAHRGAPPTVGRIVLLWAVVVAVSATLLWSAWPRDGTTVPFLYRHLAVTVVAVVAMGSLVLARLAVTASSLASTISERRRLHDRLEHQAGHDELTGLANRRQLSAHIEARSATASDLAVIFFDLDRFKDVNDQHGHGAGDELLQIIANRLRGTLRAGAIAARLGGDEFAVLLADASATEARVVGDRLVAAIQKPVPLRGGAVVVSVGASVGVASAPSREVAGRDLLHEADLAMYAAKHAGRGCVTVYDDQVHNESITRLSMRSDLRMAIERDELSLVFQPIISVESGRPVSAEALLRWDSPGRGAVPPDQFIPLAEATGDITTIGRWVLEQACRHAVAWNLDRDPADRVAVAVNVSPVQLHASGFDDLVLRTVTETGLDPTLLTLEITEGSLLEISARTRTTIGALRRAGVRFAVDDFGTGYSALRYLREIPLDELKIDRAFVEGIDGSAEDSALAFAILHLADTFGLTTVAEGVETRSQFEVLQQRGCQLVQGWLFARPMPFAELVVLLAEASIEEPDLQG